MRGVRGSQLFRRADDERPLDQMRRILDLIIASILLVLTLPLMLLVALAIKCEGPGPIFDRQNLHRARQPAFSNAEIPHQHA